MLLQAPEPSPYDLRFNLFGFDVRVSWSFWLGALFFGWNLIQYFSQEDAAASRGLYVLMWVGCMFVSILIHELGHAFAFRFYRIHSSIVLYHFGGLAIPHGGPMPSGSLRRRGANSPHWRQFWISLAGPVAQLMSVGVLAIAVKASGHAFQGHLVLGSFMQHVPWLADGDPITNRNLAVLILFYSLPSIFWAVLNLVPIYPLDGGQILKSLVTIAGGRTTTWITISLFTSVLGACYGLSQRDLMLGLFCASFAFANYQLLQQHQGRGF